MSAWMGVGCFARPGAVFLGCRGRKVWLGGHEFTVTYGQGARGCVVDKGLHLGVGCQGVSVPSCAPGAQIRWAELGRHSSARHQHSGEPCPRSSLPGSLSGSVPPPSRWPFLVHSQEGSGGLWDCVLLPPLTPRCSSNPPQAAGN